MSFHEIRDPIHNFIRLDSQERRAVDSVPFQRLRHIQQLALTSLVYPGATHKRFEHSLGVMELATKIFRVVTSEAKGSRFREVRDLLPEHDALRYWEKVLRLAALFHDVGHLPFSHGAEGLLPDGWRHEQMTAEIIRSAEMRQLWDEFTPPIKVRDLVKLAIGPRQIAKIPELRDKDRYRQFDIWEALLAEIIQSDVFGADRMDYLLRDSLHAGVAYGRFDYHRLIDTLRILPAEHENSSEPQLGVERGGLQSAESMLWARYLMYTQVYFHPVRRVYDLHLAAFLNQWLDGGEFKTDVGEYLTMTDNEVLTGMFEALADETAPGHCDAEAILRRRHFRQVYDLIPSDLKVTPEPGKAIYEYLSNQLGEGDVLHDSYRGKSEPIDFPVYDRSGKIISGHSTSEAISKMPSVAVDYVFVKPELRDDAETLIGKHRNHILRSAQPTEE